MFFHWADQIFFTKPKAERGTRIIHRKQKGDQFLRMERRGPEKNWQPTITNRRPPPLPVKYDSSAFCITHHAKIAYHIWCIGKNFKGYVPGAIHISGVPSNLCALTFCILSRVRWTRRDALHTNAHVCKTKKTL